VNPDEVREMAKAVVAARQDPDRRRVRLPGSRRVFVEAVQQWVEEVAQRC
jgi:hypothetical protein